MSQVGATHARHGDLANALGGRVADGTTTVEQFVQGLLKNVLVLEDAAGLAELGVVVGVAREDDIVDVWGENGGSDGAATAVTKVACR